MTSKERVYRTLRFQCPDRIPIDLWVLPGTRSRYGEQLDRLLARYPPDIASLDYRDPLADERRYRLGTYTDGWGTTWLNLQDGIHGEAKAWPLEDWSALRHYRVPLDRVNEGWEHAEESLRRHADRFILAPGANPFERMQHLRGTAKLLMDLADDAPELYRLRDMLMEYYTAIVRKAARYDVDGVAFADDWGSQRALLIPPRVWRSFFKPMYQELFDIARRAGKSIFFHSDGYILEIYEDLIELGVNAINSQLWCMGVETVAERFAGRVTFWGEVSRQNTLPRGTPEDVRAAALLMRKNLFVNGGGLIGQGEAGPDVPLSNIEVLLSAWND